MTKSSSYLVQCYVLQDIEDAVKARKKDVGRMLLVNFTSKRNANEVTTLMTYKPASS